MARLRRSAYFFTIHYGSGGRRISSRRSAQDDTDKRALRNTCNTLPAQGSLAATCGEFLNSLILYRLFAPFAPWAAGAFALIAW